MDLIPPVIITDVKNITSFEINQLQVKLNTSAEIFVYLKSGSDIVASELILIEGVDYANWGSDDEYINIFISNYIRSKYT
jgi:hypothetical protein